MRVTIRYPEGEKLKRINFQMADEFNEKSIKREANKIIRDRWPDLRGKIQNMEWKY